MGKSYLRDILEWKDGTEEYAGNLLQKVSEYENIIIFGAGIGGKKSQNVAGKRIWK